MNSIANKVIDANHSKIRSQNALKGKEKFMSLAVMTRASVPKDTLGALL